MGGEGWGGERNYILGTPQRLSSSNLLVPGSNVEKVFLKKFSPIYINPLTPKSDQHLISPYNIIPESHIKATRIKEMITY